MLRFFHKKNIQPSGWIKVVRKKLKTVKTKNSKCNYHFSCDYENVDFIDKNKFAPFLIGCFDIECSSFDGSFPNPQRDEDKIIQIGTTIHKYGDKECFMKHIAVLGKCDDIEGVYIECFKTEKELIMGWADLVSKHLDLDIISGYNIWGFDFMYLYERSKKFGDKFKNKFLKRLSREKNKPSIWVEKQLSSSALGDNNLRYIDMPGRVQLDLFKLIQKDHKLDSYKLDNVASVFMKENKVDLTPNQLFANYKIGTPDKLKEIAVYCVKDCDLCNRLIIKLEVIANNIGMSNVCCVPLEYLFVRGQGIKIFSLVLKQAMEEGFVIKVVKREDQDASSYEGAIVFDPDPGVYFDPIAVNDYASLYPSSMIAENISHDSLTWAKTYDLNGNLISTIGNEQFDKLEGYHYNDIEYDVFEMINDKKVITGKKICRYAEKDDMEKSILPRIEQHLLTARRATKKRMKHLKITMKDGTIYEGQKNDVDKDTFSMKCDNETIDGLISNNIEKIEKRFLPFEIAILDGLQLAYKVTCNSLYGQVGAATSPICFKELAASTTAVGRKMVMVAKELTEEKYAPAKVVYGDSVTGDTPLLLKNKNNEIIIDTIENISKNWIDYQEFKSNETNRKEKQQSYTEYQIWTNNKWSNIKRVIRHKTKKDIYRVSTHCGVVDVTEDHSLLDENINIIKPKQCIIGKTKLLQSFPKFDKQPKLNLKNILDLIKNIKKFCISNELKEAFIYGFFYGDGSCGYYNCKSGDKYSWALNNKDLYLLNVLKEFLKDIYGNILDFKILDTLKSSNVYKLVGKGDIKYITNLFRSKCYDNNKYKIIPRKYYNSNYDLKLCYFLGYYAADGSKSLNDIGKSIRFDNKGKIGSMQLYYLCKSLGFNCSINTRVDKPNIYRINCTFNKNRKILNQIKKFQKLRTINNNEFVYDIETEDSIFHAGVGEIIVKNTDSIFINFMPLISKKYGDNLTKEEKLKHTIDLGLESGEYVTKHLKKPQDLEYEKVFYPFVIFTKKRYFGNKYETDVTKYKQTSMGIVTKRRDNPNIVKIIYSGVIDAILNKENIEVAKEYFIAEVVKLLAGHVDIKELIVSKSLKSRAKYKNPTTIAHQVLADRINDRDPGTGPQANDRVPYVYRDFDKIKCSFDGCKKKMNKKECKCRTCLKLYCPEHLKNHRKLCKRICRFCKKTDGLKRCIICLGYYCDECMIKHKTKEDKKGNITYDKCKKELQEKALQGDLLEDPKYAVENKVPLDYRYYLDHQIKTPVLQIFDLVMDDAESLIRDLLVKNDNKKAGNTMITDFFKFS